MKNNITTTQKKAVLFGALSEALEQKNEAAALFIEQQLLKFTNVRYSNISNENYMTVEVSAETAAVELYDRVLTSFREVDAHDWYTSQVIDKTLLPPPPAGKQYVVWDANPVTHGSPFSIATIKIIDNK